jgi:hypothetical protein
MKFLPEIITLTSSGNNMKSGKFFFVGGRSLKYMIGSKARKIYPCDNPCFTVPNFEKNFSNDFNLLVSFYFSVRF